MICDGVRLRTIPPKEVLTAPDQTSWSSHLQPLPAIFPCFRTLNRASNPIIPSLAHQIGYNDSLFLLFFPHDTRFFLQQCEAASMHIDNRPLLGLNEGMGPQTFPFISCSESSKQTTNMRYPQHNSSFLLSNHTQATDVFRAAWTDARAHLPK